MEVGPTNSRPTFGRCDVGVIAEAKLVPSTSAPRPPALLQRKQKPLDLGGKRPAGFLIGPNGSGKTTGVRFIIDRALDAGRDLAIAALDKGDRSLSTSAVFPRRLRPTSKVLLTRSASAK